MQSSIQEDYLEAVCQDDENTKVLKAYRPTGFYLCVGNGRVASYMLDKPIPRHTERAFGFYCPDCRLDVMPIGKSTKTIRHCNSKVAYVPQWPDLSFKGLVAAVEYALLPRFKWSPVGLFRL